MIHHQLLTGQCLLLTQMHLLQPSIVSTTTLGLVSANRIKSLSHCHIWLRVYITLSVHLPHICITDKLILFFTTGSNFFETGDGSFNDVISEVTRLNMLMVDRVVISAYYNHRNRSIRENINDRIGGVVTSVSQQCTCT